MSSLMAERYAVTNRQGVRSDIFEELKARCEPEAKVERKPTSPPTAARTSYLDMMLDNANQQVDSYLFGQAAFVVNTCLF